jgi:hypothetical protein
MGMQDVVDLYNRVGEGAEVTVIQDPLIQTREGRKYALKRPEDAYPSLMSSH